MVYRKFFEILHDVMAFLVLFEQILTKRFTSHSEFFIKYDAFCLHIFHFCVLSSDWEWIQNILVRDTILN